MTSEREKALEAALYLVWDKVLTEYHSKDSYVRQQVEEALAIPADDSEPVTVKPLEWEERGDEMVERVTSYIHENHGSIKEYPGQDYDLVRAALEEALSDHDHE